MLPTLTTFPRTWATLVLLLVKLTRPVTSVAFTASTAPEPPLLQSALALSRLAWYMSVHDAGDGVAALMGSTLFRMGSSAVTAMLVGNQMETDT